MAKIIDITEQLNFEDKPKLKIKDTEIEINDTAETMLKIVSIMDGETTPEKIKQALSYLFSEEDLRKLFDLGLKFNDLMKIIEISVDTITNENGQTGEIVTPAMI